ncbi:MAG TPA: hypothetical protein VGB94_02625 [Acidobacteriaceae bacterium]
MSTATVLMEATPPTSRQVRAYFAPVDRNAETPTSFDAAADGRFELDTPPSPWVDLGCVAGFARSCVTKIEPLLAGSPNTVRSQVRQTLEATVKLEFMSWGKLQMALTTGAQHMNLPLVAGTTAAVCEGSTATCINVGAGNVGAFAVGQMIAVDVDYAPGATGFVGSGVSAAYVTAAASAVIGSDTNYTRRVTLNTGRIAAVTAASLELEAPLVAGDPTTDMTVIPICGFVDREGGNFFQEWSGLFVLDGEQGDRVIFYYPRLQTMQGATETQSALTKPLCRWGLAGAFRALPVMDAMDGESVVCYRSYLPAV